VAIRLYNTFARGVEDFVPGDPNRVTMYVCGPTVYDFAHIGNARPVVVFDTLFRLLRHAYGEDHVIYARNFTDIDDKIMVRAAEEGRSIKAVTKEFIDHYQRDMGALGTLAPTLTPKATEHLPQMIQMMRTLIDKGYAYEAEGHVLFHVPAMESYGALSRHSRDELIAGARVEVAPYKKDPADFVMWKPSTGDQPGWNSPFGYGRPGWHLECSCMTARHLGETIDIHGGGQDLIFPHHENEIAQSECAHGTQFSRYWMHNGYLTVDGEKMSKSLGNFHTVHDLLTRYKGEALRLSLMVAHYRQPIDFSTARIAEQKKRLDRWYSQTADVMAAAQVPDGVIAALCDDLNTPKAIAELDRLSSVGAFADLKAAAEFMGFLGSDAGDWFGPALPDGVTEDDILAAIAARKVARAEKEFAESDRIRDDLLARGVALEDGPEGTSWRRAD